ncbi:NADPH-dependent FMN reductase [Oleidesulfovibrio alaskensis G20]|jgi:multimeric flavodoxin WrbA|uniref:NADPH-dependent FMN reductase n=1 Tax=Oleidesulfovibrio alaskensis (strain ATCC BAA-1058 / DSM 17464 / G20) TaxID=207559 RepID=Q314R0_OLEA2|nr:NAD(P)H-dependent oxidoreductase [Oleidesulfovibrio alaskensis]ABB37586.1 NADPH-dependent FMN reductase [Oleidesulfovibrio alaskensis G20]MBG0774754.1 flavodoxin family protein [Oleidesulfovibrio alaskensis]MBL3581347.1 flavodoxin family protein [Oleidesulfovibrio alaskensis]
MSLLSEPLTVHSISCSPRAGGNSDKAAELFADGFAAAGGADILHLRRYDIRPCTSCYRCEHDPDGWCFLEDMDQSACIFRLLQEAPALHFASPVYFYHVPAHFKALIDRTQRFWLLRERGDARMLQLPRRKAWVTMIAGRRRGEKLFEGSLLTLKYFLKSFNIDMQEPLLLTGLDDAEALERQPETLQQITAYGRQAAEAFLRSDER